MHTGNNEYEDDITIQDYVKTTLRINTVLPLCLSVHRKLFLSNHYSQFPTI